ncbi:Uncharacterised protein [Mycobacterium tuberculosis]|uniref:Uncharacterized protein n=1 Tax=Mycobacterium tuberculosis TaxID=1773 RepID=A0A655AC49_MYCTX|nr:Uncharacterised protein [Mycobacterium tuberculosis]CKU77704.1 Uncharacterised protein [Mycobacterium tuberculosis]
MVDGVAADDAGAHHTYRRLRVTLPAADRPHQRTYLGREGGQRLAHLHGQVAGDRECGRHGGEHAVAHRPDPGGAHPNRTDRCRLELTALPVRDPALGGFDVHVGNNRGAVTLDNDRDAAV